MGKESIVTGLALFAMFFGAGNLIFPPYLGLESGWEWPLGFACFILIDVVLSCLGIYALNAAGGANAAIEGTLGHRPGLVMNTAAILCTGVLIATPRTAATTFEMAVVPIAESFSANAAGADGVTIDLGVAGGGSASLALFSVIFFAVVLLLTIKESRVVDIVGKILTPLLVLGIVILVVAGIVHPLAPIQAPLSTTVAQDGILAGYQTMDIIACVGFAIVVQDAIRGDGFKSRKTQLQVMAFASVIAAVLLGGIYGGLTYLGATAGGMFGAGVGQAELIVKITNALLGEFGVVTLGIVVGLACLTTAIGLTGATAAYFERITHGRLSYRWGVLLVIGCSLLICNLGLEAIIALASPILQVVCPPFMTTVVLILFLRFIHSTWVYKGAALGALVASLLIACFDTFGVPGFVAAMPLQEFGFAWLPFAVLGGIGGWLAARPAHKTKDLLASPVEEAVESGDSLLG